MSLTLCSEGSAYWLSSCLVFVMISNVVVFRRIPSLENLLFVRFSKIGERAMGPSEIGEERFKKIVEEALHPPSQKRESTEKVEQPTDWKDLQAKVREIYEDLGCEAKENIPVKGARSKHKIDVLAIFEFGGHKFRIVVECKYWSTRVKKTQVASLLGVLADIGAEKGIIVSKQGFQSGAYRLASYTPIDLLTFGELKNNSERFIEKFKVQTALERIQSLSLPFRRFRSKMWEETGKLDLFWYPSEKGGNFIGSLGMLRSHIEDLDLKTFPRRYFYSFVSKREEEVWKAANSRQEYLDCILDNLEILKQEYEDFKEEIFSE